MEFKLSSRKSPNAILAQAMWAISACKVIKVAGAIAAGLFSIGVATGMEGALRIKERKEKKNKKKELQSSEKLPDPMIGLLSPSLR